MRIYTSIAKEKGDRSVHRMTTRPDPYLGDIEVDGKFQGPTVYRIKPWKSWWVSCCSPVGKANHKKLTISQAVRWLHRQERKMNALDSTKKSTR